MRKVLRATELIGDTPVVRLNKIASEGSSTIWAKLEFFNPGGSVKDRMATAMIEEAEASGALKSGDTIIEPTSGNAGIGLAFVAAQKGYRIILVIPEIMSVDKMGILRALGAELLLVPAGDGMSIAVETAKNLAAKHGYFMPNQFTNQANSAVHERTTGVEIAEAFADTGLDYFVAGVGTGGTITGVGGRSGDASPRSRFMRLNRKDRPSSPGRSQGNMVSKETVPDSCRASLILAFMTTLLRSMRKMPLKCADVSRNPKDSSWEFPPGPRSGHRHRSPTARAAAHTS